MKRTILFLFAFICADLRLTSLAFAAPTPVPDNLFDKAAAELDKAKAETQKLKDAWDKARLETTLYEQRVKRATQKWTKAAKDAKQKAKEQKERSEVEFQLAVEKRKLAYNEWQTSQLRTLSKESQLKALDQQKESAAIQDRIRKLESKLGPATDKK